MEQNTQTTPGTEAATRPVFLTVLCILSFIFAGLAVLGYIFVITAMGAITAGASALEGMAADSGATMTYTGPSVALTWAYLIVGFVTVLASLYGVIQMWKLKKIGFFIYVGASVVSMIMGIVYSGFGVVGVIFPILFIVLYGLNLKHMK